MKVNRYIYTSLLTALLIGWGCLLTSCTDRTDIKQEHPDNQSGVPLHVEGLTRSDGDPEPESDPLIGQTVMLFLNQGETTQKGELIYSGKNMSSDLTPGSSDLTVKPGKDYLVFGYLPSRAADASSDVTVNGNTNTAAMTIKDLSSISTEDISVVIGVKGKMAADDEEEVEAGSFKYHAPEDTEEGYGVSLLVDHLYAALNLKFVVDPGYDALRTIKLHTVKLITTRNKKLNATVSLTMNDTGENPISAVSYDNSDNSQDEEIVLFQSTNTDGDVLSASTPLFVTGYIAVGYGSDLKIESKYEVYDKKDLVYPLPSPDEPDDSDDPDEYQFRYAVNDLSAVCTSMTRGEKKTVNMTIIPTYLYILSDNDLDNPTIVVGGE